jgi:hypothetical protein
MSQVAAYPLGLASLVSRLKYKAGWQFTLSEIDRGQGSAGLTLIIEIDVPDSYHPERRFRVLHYMIVPPAAFDERAWCRWLLEQILLVEQHEACEFFQIEGHRPYAPNHGPGRDPYTIMDQGTEADARTTFRGESF